MMGTPAENLSFHTPQAKPTIRLKLPLAGTPTKVTPNPKDSSNSPSLTSPTSVSSHTAMTSSPASHSASTGSPSAVQASMMTPVSGTAPRRSTRTKAPAPTPIRAPATPAKSPGGRRRKSTAHSSKGRKSSSAPASVETPKRRQDDDGSHNEVVKKRIILQANSSTGSKAPTDVGKGSSPPSKKIIIIPTSLAPNNQANTSVAISSAPNAVAKAPVMTALAKVKAAIDKPRKWEKKLVMVETAQGTSFLIPMWTSPAFHTPGKFTKKSKVSGHRVGLSASSHSRPAAASQTFEDRKVKIQLKDGNFCEVQVTDNNTKWHCCYPPCVKTFSAQHLMRKHLLTHGPKDVVCQVPGCDKAFINHPKLRRHMLTHGTTPSALPGEEQAANDAEDDDDDDEEEDEDDEEDEDMEAQAVEEEAEDAEDETEVGDEQDDGMDVDDDADIED